MTDEEIRRADAEAFAKVVSELLVAVEVLPRDLQQRALDILKAAFPDDRDVKAQPPVDWYRQAGTLSAKQQSILDNMTPIGTIR